MPANSYNWVPDDLVEAADEIGEWLRDRGYSVRVENAPPGFPYPPTFLATRGKLERIVVEVLATWQEDRMVKWLAYAKGCQKEFKICVGLSHQAKLPGSVTDKIRRSGIGIVRGGKGVIVQELEPADAAINVSIPERKTLDNGSKKVLGPAYDHFESSRWREGFDESVKALESSAKKYLKKWVKTGRISFVTKKGPKTYSEKQMNRFTMGDLENAFNQIQAQNSSDRVIYKALKLIRQDRNKFTHNKWTVAREKRLRANVSQHIWVITQAITETLK